MKKETSKCFEQCRRQRTKYEKNIGRIEAKRKYNKEKRISAILDVCLILREPIRMWAAFRCAIVGLLD